MLYEENNVEFVIFLIKYISRHTQNLDDRYKTMMKFPMNIDR